MRIDKDPAWLAQLEAMRIASRIAIRDFELMNPGAVMLLKMWDWMKGESAMNERESPESPDEVDEPKKKDDDEEDDDDNEGKSDK